MSGFSNAIIGGAQKLIRRAIQSPNYVLATTGWSINKDGSAEFNTGTFRGGVVVGTPPSIIGLDPAGPDIFFNPDTTAFDTNGFLDFSPSTLGRAGIALISPYNNATGDGPASINLTSSGSGTPALITLASDDLITNAPVHSTWNGKGKTAVNVGPVLAGTIATIVSATVIVPANSFQSDFKVTVTWAGVLTSGTTTDVLYNMRINRDGTQIGGCRVVGPPHNQNDGGRALVATDIGVPAGPHTYTLSVSHEAASTATDLTVQASAAAPAIILVEGC